MIQQSAQVGGKFEPILPILVKTTDHPSRFRRARVHRDAVSWEVTEVSG